MRGYKTEEMKSWENWVGREICLGYTQWHNHIICISFIELSSENHFGLIFLLLFFLWKEDKRKEYTILFGKLPFPKYNQE